MSVTLTQHSHGLAYAELERLATSIASSGLFGIRTKDQAVALMMIAHAEGRHPALAARDYDIISGRPAKKAEAMLRDFIEGGGKVQWHTLDDTTADATFSHPSGGTVRINWTMERAAKAGLGGKENYKKFPRQMLRSRTVSEGVRTVYPLATSGMYVPEEVSDFTGPTIEARPEPEAKPAKPGGMVEEARAAVAEKPPSTRTIKAVVADIIARAGSAQSIAALSDLEKEPDTQKVLDRGEDSDAAKAVRKALREGAERVAAATVFDEEPEPERMET